MKLLPVIRSYVQRPLVRPWALAGPVLVLILCLPMLRPLRQPDSAKWGDEEQMIASTVQALGIGPFRLVAFNDEMCLGYQLAVKKGLAPAPTLVSGYCGCSRSYVPTADLIPQGGYEAHSNIWVYLEPAPLAPKTEQILVSTALRLAGAKR